MPSPRVTVGITTRNRAKILPSAIESVLRQDFKDLEIVVLDDASTDQTPDLAIEYPEIRWHRNEKTLGIIACRNRLMKESQADFYLSLDDDAWFLRDDELSMAISCLDERPEVGAIAFEIVSPDRPDSRPRTHPESVSMFIGCGHILRLAAAAQVGFYAPTPGQYGSEEKDLCIRLADRGNLVLKLPGVHVWHDKAWDGRNWLPLHRSGVCNEFVMTIRRCPMPDLLAVIPLKLLSFMLFWLRRMDLAKAGLLGVWDTMRLFEEVWRHRQPVSRHTFWSFSRRGKKTATTKS